MRRDLSMVRKLEKIEKEIGYCEIKLEKEQRLQTQAHFLRMHHRSVLGAIRDYQSKIESSLGNRIGGLSLVEVDERVSVAPDSTNVADLREQFRGLGALPLLEEGKLILEQECDELEDRLRTFEAFKVKKIGLLTEKAEALTTFDYDGYEPILEITAEFEKIEQSWNTLTEDLMNADEAIFYISRALDYLGSARNFVLASRSQFAIDGWLRTGYLVDLFNHSSVARAKEMVEGADRNLKKGLMELICLEQVLISPADFEQILTPFLDALFDDLFKSGKLIESLDVVDHRIGLLDRLRRELEEIRDKILDEQHEEEANRVRLFAQMGRERKKLTLATQP